MNYEIKLQRVVNDKLVEDVTRIIPYLTSSNPEITKDWLRVIIESPCNTLLVAKTEDDTVIGMLSLVIFPLPSGLRARIEDVVVDEQYQGYGIGKQLNEVAIDIAKRRNVKSLDLTSHPERGAGVFYENLGFEKRDTGVYRYAK